MKKVRRECWPSRVIFASMLGGLVMGSYSTHDALRAPVSEWYVSCFVVLSLSLLFRILFPTKCTEIELFTFQSGLPVFFVLRILCLWFSLPLAVVTCGFWFLLAAWYTCLAGVLVLPLVVSFQTALDVCTTLSSALSREEKSCSPVLDTVRSNKPG